MSDYAAVFLVHTGQKTGDVFECNQRNIETVAESNEPRSLIRSVDIQNTGQKRRLIGYDADRPAIQARESDDNVFGEVLLHFEKISIIDDWMNDVADVVRNV